MSYYSKFMYLYYLVLPERFGSYLVTITVYTNKTQDQVHKCLITAFKL